MDRRKFIANIPVALIASGTSTKLFGSPDSIKTSSEISLLSKKNEDSIKYRLSKISVSPSQWDEIINVSQVWSNICSSEAEAEKFCADSKNYLTKQGLDSEAQQAIESELNALKVFLDRDIISSVKNGDPEKFFQTLADKNLIKELNNASRLREKLDAGLTLKFNLLSRHETREQLQVKEALFSIYDQLSMLDENRDFKVILGNQLVPVAAAAIVVIAVSVVAYATVAIAAGAGILAAVAISIFAATAVFVGGGGGHGMLQNQQNVISEMALAAQISGSVGNNELTHAILNDIEKVKNQVGHQLDKILDLAIEKNLINFDGIDEKRMRASLHSLVNTQLFQIS